MHVLCSGVRNSRSRSYKVIHLGTNRKRLCNFLLVINSNLGPILSHFRDIPVAGFPTFPLRTATPSLFHPNFWGVPIRPDGRCRGSEERRPYASYSCNYFESNPTYMATIHKRADRRTDRLT